MVKKDSKVETILKKILGLVNELTETHKLPVLFYNPQHGNQTSQIFGSKFLKEWFQQKKTDEEQAFKDLIKEDIKELTATNSHPPDKKPRSASRKQLKETRGDQPPEKLKQPVEYLLFPELQDWLRVEYLRVYHATGGLMDQIHWGDIRFRPASYPAPETGFPKFEDLKNMGSKGDVRLKSDQLKQLAILALRAQGINDPDSWVKEDNDKDELNRRIKYKKRSLPDVEHLLPADDPEVAAQVLPADNPVDPAQVLEVVIEEGDADADSDGVGHLLASPGSHRSDASASHTPQGSPPHHHSDQSASPPQGSPLQSASHTPPGNPKNGPPAGDEVTTPVQSPESSHQDPASHSQRPKPFPPQEDEPATPDRSAGSSAATPSTPTTSGPTADSDSDDNSRPFNKDRPQYRPFKRAIDLSRSEKWDQNQGRADRANRRDKNIRPKSDRSDGGSGGQNELRPVRGRFPPEHYNRQKEASRQARAAATRQTAGSSANHQRDLANNNSFSEETDNGATRGDQ